MKKLARIFLFSLFALWLTPNLIGGIKIVGDWQTYIISSAALSLIFLFVKPVLRLFLLPVNLLSLGLLSWVVNVAILYLLTLIIPQIKISDWNFPGISYEGFVIPSYYFNQIATFVIVSLILSFIINFLVWISK